ncbi:MAG TPA: Holliday junction branch migration protein RuvA [Actinomycetota bacterium]|nr:Holliday junction branch migration protein RuvA [Actinomycetota bacterium]
MITSLSGTIMSVGTTGAEVDVNGVGYWVYLPGNFLASVTVGQTVRMPVHLVVREDSMTLYGFADSSQRETFRALIGTNGVGPKLALSILSVLSPESLRRAVTTGDHAQLTSVPGIGKRVAERIVVELKEKLGPSIELASSSSAVGEAREALLGLGYTPAEVRDALAACEETEAVENIVKSALKELAKV